MHVEDLELQNRCVELFEAMDGEAKAAGHEGFEGAIKYAKQHRDIVQRFGRFPHRNEILGRETTAEEAEFLKQPGSSF